MENLFVLFIVWVIVSGVVSSFFSDREIGSGTVFLLSLFLSPIIGILIGLSSKRKDEVQPIKSHPKTGSKRSNRKNEIITRLEEIKRMEDVDLGSEELTKEKEELKKEFQEIENELKSDQSFLTDRYDNLEDFHQMIFRERLNITDDNIITYIYKLDFIKTDKRIIELQTDKFDLKVKYEFVKVDPENGLSRLVWFKFYGYK